MRVRIGKVVVLTCVAVMAGAIPAYADFPGENGKILYRAGDETGAPDTELWTVNPDGSGATDVTNTPGIRELSGAFSPDGQRIAVNSSSRIWVMNADGTGRTDITPVTAFGPPKPRDVTWSPDGFRIAFTNSDVGCAAGHSPGAVVRMNADGTGAATVVCAVPTPLGSKSHGGDALGWSPDGSSIAFEAPFGPDCAPHVWKVNPDGSGLTQLTNGASEGGPDWAPDASKLVFEANGACLGEHVWTMNPDGSGQVQIDVGQDPVWSPDRRRIAFDRGNDIWLMNSDGTGQVNITNTPSVAEYTLSWQPIQRGYARPKGATPVYASLALAFKPCAAPSRTHAAPLAFPSCNPAQLASSRLTVGTPDANSRAANSTGHVRLGVVGEVPVDPNNGNQADVTIEVAVTDVREQASLDDYTGELRAQAALRITDRDNTPNPGGPGPGTVKDTTFAATVPCAATSLDSTIGSTCSLTTTANTLIPNSVVERKRAIWELGQVRVYDGGTDGDGDTGADNTLFEVQGIFIP